jgi:L-serine dehydratase
MTVSIFDIFKIGIGPSSSHTVGPMCAGDMFARTLSQKKLLGRTDRVTVELMGSLAATGRGHGTDKAAMLGLMGERPATVDPDRVPGLIAGVAEKHELLLGGEKAVAFDPARDIIFHPDKVPAYHTNGIAFAAYGAGQPLYERRYYSVGGGFVVPALESDPEKPEPPEEKKDAKPLPFPYSCACELVELAEKHRLSIAEIVFQNECTAMSQENVAGRIDRIWDVMHASIERGFRQSGELPGPFHVARRAKALRDEILSKPQDPMAVIDWVNAYAMAVAEENASGGRIVTAPTNGAAGIVPAVIEYYLKQMQGSSAKGVRVFLLTAGAIGALYKENASISGAEVGCQGEVGVACSMAAGGLAAAMGGTPRQIENAAEIGMEHNLGLTCDPVAGQVQIPCIERNAIAAVKAINAARMALRGTGSHLISLDKAIAAMLATGRDMQSKYKETSRGGLAITMVQC